MIFFVLCLFSLSVRLQALPEKIHRAQQNAKWVGKTQSCGSLHKGHHRMGTSGHGKLCGEDREGRKLAPPYAGPSPSEPCLILGLVSSTFAVVDRHPSRCWRVSAAITRWRGGRPALGAFLFEAGLVMKGSRRSHLALCCWWASALALRRGSSDHRRGIPGISSWNVRLFFTEDCCGRLVSNLKYICI